MHKTDNFYLEGRKLVLNDIITSRDILKERLTIGTPDKNFDKESVKLLSDLINLYLEFDFR